MVTEHVMPGARLCITYLAFVLSVKFVSFHYLGADFVINVVTCASVERESNIVCSERSMVHHD